MEEVPQAHAKRKKSGSHSSEESEDHVSFCSHNRKTTNDHKMVLLSDTKEGTRDPNQAIISSPPSFPETPTAQLPRSSGQNVFG